MPEANLSDLTNYAGIALSLLQWAHSISSSKTQAGLQEYLEYLRRTQHAELAASLETSQAALHRVEQSIQRLAQGSAGNPELNLPVITDAVIQALFDFKQHQADNRYATFEQSYLQHIRHRFRTIKTLGVREMRDMRQDLSVAYVSLNLAACSTSEQNVVPLASDIFLKACPLLTVRGPAGSGKTTLLHWIAVQCAESQLVEGVWTGKIPFFVPLRALPESSKGKPRIHDLVSLSTDPSIFASTPPKSWVEHVLKSGRAVLLVDGVDELPVGLRPNFWEWVNDWSDSYQGNRFYVTSRFLSTGPKAKSSWNPPKSFISADVRDMSDEDVKTFVERWHLAAIALEADAEEKNRIAIAAKALPDRLLDRANHRVRDLCRTPLLCALVCALHLREEGYLPSRRIDLYRRCCEMLIEERDRKRNIAPPPEPLSKLSIADKEMLLQRLAWSMMTNAAHRSTEQRIEIDREQAMRWLKPALKSCDELECRAAEPEEVLTFLVERTGLLREPTKGRVDFVHRTFQEYMAACAAGYHDDAVALAKKSSDDQWHETIILAAGTSVGGSSFGNSLIEALLDRSEKLQAARASNTALALALACLETGNQIKPSLSKRVIDRLEALVPPASPVIAKQLSIAGDSLLPLLSYAAVKKHGWRAVALSALAIAHVGTSSAVEALTEETGFGSDTRPSVIRSILSCRAVNPLRLKAVREILADADGPSHLSVRTFAQVDDLAPLMGHKPKFLYLLDAKVNSFAPLAQMTSLIRLILSRSNFSDNDSIYLEPLTDLSMLRLTDCNITDRTLEVLCKLSELRTLSLDSTGITANGLQQLEDLPSLHALHVSRISSECNGCVDLSRLNCRIVFLDQSNPSLLPSVSTMGKLRALSLNRTKLNQTSLECLKNMKELVALSAEESDLGDQAVEYLVMLPKLKLVFAPRSKLTPSGAKLLRQAKPECKVDLGLSGEHDGESLFYMYQIGNE